MYIIAVKGVIDMSKVDKAYQELEELEYQKKLILHKIQLLKGEVTEKELAEDYIYKFAKYIKPLLKSLNIRQVEVGNRCGITRPTISKIVNGENKGYSTLRNVFISLLFICAEQNKWEMMYIFFHNDKLFGKIMEENYKLSEEESKEINQGIDNTLIPFGEYKIPKDLFDLMMKI